MCHKYFIFFIICYKVNHFYINNIHLHNTETLTARNIDTPILRFKQTKLNFKIANICIYLLNTYKLNLEIFNSEIINLW